LRALLCDPDDFHKCGNMWGRAQDFPDKDQRFDIPLSNGNISLAEGEDEIDGAASRSLAGLELLLQVLNCFLDGLDPFFSVTLKIVLVNGASNS
jgi:hypothetical protein